MGISCSLLLNRKVFYMGKIIKNGIEYGGTPINSALFNAIYPIGSVYISVSSTNPASLFGGT